VRYESNNNLSTNTKGEIIANSITHGLGVGLSIAGLVILIIRAVNRGTPWHLASYIIFGISLLLLYRFAEIRPRCDLFPYSGNIHTIYVN